MENVHQWLSSSQDYHAGIRILLQYCTDANLRALFREEETEYKRKRLLKAMQDLVSPPVLEDVPEPTAALPILIPSPATAPVSHHGWPNPITDQVVQRLYDQWKPDYARLMALVHVVYEVALQGENGNTLKEIEAGRLAHEILDLDDQVQEYYQKRDLYLAHGHYPELKQQEEEIVEPRALYKALDNAERYVRRYRDKIKQQPKHKSVPKWTALLLEYEKDVLKYKKLLKL
ncbi:MAG: hypothetical protein ACTHMC_25210 [Pseudobacter sp.]|uniref:hypothetical protein n=1 Tax=Pseudobacter sp. TaxID=2045420 RepID=UPI003F7EE528